MMQNYDVIALGELLIDFTENGHSEQGNPILEANPGGAPANVLSMLCRMGKKTMFIGKVGKDSFGTQLEEALLEVGIKTDGLVKTEDVHTTLAFVHTLPDGDREFAFYRNPGADMMLSSKDIVPDWFKNAKVFHFGSLSMTAEPCRETTKYALKLAKEAGLTITYDPNLRESLWSDQEKAREMIAYGMSMCDVMKISDNEVLWFTGKDNYDDAVAAIRSQYKNIKLLLLTLGKDGSRAYLGDTRVDVPGFVQQSTIETTGAGDTFCGMAIHYILEHGLILTEAQLKEMLTLANAAASIITTRKGAIRVMPTIDDVMALLQGGQS